MRRFALVLVVAVACGGHRRSSPPPAECARIAQHVIDLELGKLTLLPGSLLKSLDGGLPAFRAAIMQNCSDEGWSTAAISCLAEAKSADDTKACDSSFTPDQGKHLRAAYDSFVQPLNLAVERWTAGVRSAVQQLCTCTDATCRAAARHDYDHLTAEARSSTNSDLQHALASFDADARCGGSAAGSGS
ncbi:MAG TPA: hypothetical protein VGG74_19420 [Kofleriaceae bacterium]|jgi:hypothetical protein